MTIFILSRANRPNRVLIVDIIVPTTNTPMLLIVY